jgi:demethylmenaquinone methyltransferase/2-methoxy-6-polyprenyl-1,4-benzoquinol methylase
VAGRYDLLNDVLSCGLDRRWRRRTARAVTHAADPNGWALDLGCGTGRLGALLAHRTRVVGVDLSHAMLRAAQRRGGDSRRLRLVEGSAFRLPFADGAFAVAVSGFVLRNLDDLPAAFAELHRVVGPGGAVALVDIGEPPNALARSLFDGYFRMAAWAWGSLAGRRSEYQYLVESLARLPSPAIICGLLHEAGFSDPSSQRLTGGVVTLFTATKA